MKASLIITTYEWPEALEATLLTALDQSVSDYEVIVADDGSGPETAETVRRVAARAAVPVTHVWQEDRGFRAARVRNRAAARASGDYLIFIDGDSLVGRHFIRDHMVLAEAGYFVAGSRVRISAGLTRELLDQLPSMPRVDRAAMWQWWFSGRVRRIHPVVRVHLPALRYIRPRRWQAVFGCNMAVHKKDFVSVNGFDNEFVGWGHEDSELAARFFNAGIMRKEGKFFCYVCHLDHGKRSRHARWVNYGRLQETLRTGTAYAANGYWQVGAVESRGPVPRRPAVAE